MHALHMYTLDMYVRTSVIQAAASAVVDFSLHTRIHLMYQDNL